MGDRMKKMEAFEWMYRKDACRFWGGPLHGETMKVDSYYPEVHTHVIDDVRWEENPSEYVSYKIARYKRTFDTFIVWNYHLEKRHCYVFMGIE